MPSTLPLLYGELAAWFHLVSSPEEYEEEVAVYRPLLKLAHPAERLLELGSGAGCNAFHLKRDFACTLTDVSPDMLEASRRINPECEHVVGDMRTLRLQRQFDVVFVHDAIMYMTTEDDLQKAMTTAFVHCRPGGWSSSLPIASRRPFTRPRNTAEATAPGARCATSNGPGIPTRATRRTWSTTSTSCARGMVMSAWCTT